MEFNERGEKCIMEKILFWCLIVMLSFAMVSKVSSDTSDDAEPDESGLNVPVGSIGSQTEMPCESSAWMFLEQYRLIQK